ncbi:von Willebrand factor type A domain-containing protein [Aspergillus floccosus]
MDTIDRLQSGLYVHYGGVRDSRSITHVNPVFHQQESDSNPLAPSSTHTPQSPQIEDNTSPCPLPLLSVSVDVDVSGRSCTTKVTQEFSNASYNSVQNANYVFPVYDGAVVTSFRCMIGKEKVLEGEVKAKEAARADFQCALSQQKAAVLVEELTPEIFETNVGNIPVQTIVRVEIVYMNFLKVDNTTGGLVLTIPTAIAPRYGVEPETYGARQDLLTDGLKINILASMPAAIRKMESCSHPISVEIGPVAHESFPAFAAGVSSETFDPTRARATLVDRSGVLDQDFILHIFSGSREFTRSRAVVVPQPGDHAACTIAVTLHPGDLFLKTSNAEDFDGEIIFMVDRSGSMASKMKSLINVLNIFLRSLPQKCAFNIASFGTRVTWMWPISEPYSQESLDTATKQVGLFQANFGGTNIYSALQSVQTHHNTTKDVPTNVIVLTDGEVWDVDSVVQLVKTMSSSPDLNIRFFSIGIGEHVSHRLVEGIGEQGGGYAEVVAKSSTGSWQERVIQMLKAALTPSRLRCEVDLGPELANRTYEKKVSSCIVQRPLHLQAPYHIPVMNTFSHFSVYYMVNSGMAAHPATITISATTDKGEKLTAQLPLEKATDAAAIHHLAAKALMNGYETGQSWLHALNPTLTSTNPAVLEKILKEEAQSLGTKWSIIGKWTSYVAVDRTTAQQHEISVRKALAVELSQLAKARPRTPVTTMTAMGQFGNYRGSAHDTKARLSAVPQSHFMQAPMMSSQFTMHSKRSRKAVFLQEFSDVAPNSAPLTPQSPSHELETDEEEIQMPPEAPPPAPPVYKEDTADVDALWRGRDNTLPNFLLDNVLHTQAADGEFRLRGTGLEKSLVKECQATVLEQFFESVFHNTQSVRDKDTSFSSLHLNILAVIYITDRHAGSKALWELQIAKARRWIKQKITELSGRENGSLNVQDNSLDELENAIIKELHSRMSNEKDC